MQALLLTSCFVAALLVSLALKYWLATRQMRHVAAHREAPTGTLVQVMDQVRQGGIENVSLAATAAAP